MSDPEISAEARGATRLVWMGAIAVVAVVASLAAAMCRDGASLREQCEARGGRLIVDVAYQAVCVREAGDE